MGKRIVIAAICILIIGGVIYYFSKGSGVPSSSTQKQIGGDRSPEGCLISGGYSFDSQVGACTRAFEFTADIKRAAQIAVQEVGKSYALTVVSFNSYEDVGTYDITLERGLDRERVTIYLKNWKISSEPNAFKSTAQAIQFLLSKKYNKPLSEVNVTVTKEVPGFAAGSVLFGQGGPGEGGMWLAVLGNGWQLAWDGNGSVDCDKMRQQYGIPDTILKPNFCN